jgi:hypothetical protein
LDEHLIAAIRDGKATKIQRIVSGCGISELHQVLTICADVYVVMIDGAFGAVDRPLQGIAGSRSSDGKAVSDARFNLRAFFVVVPRY